MDEKGYLIRASEKIARARRELNELQRFIDKHDPSDQRRKAMLEHVRPALRGINSEVFWVDFS